MSDWYYYEERVLQNFITTIRSTLPSVQLVLFKTTNTICDRKKLGADKIMNALYVNQSQTVQHSAKNTTLANVWKVGVTNSTKMTTSLMTENNNNHTNSKHNTTPPRPSRPITTFRSIATKYCSEGTVNQDGTNHLNARLHTFVTNYKNNNTNNNNTSLIVDVFHNNIIDSCDYTQTTQTGSESKNKNLPAHHSHRQ